MRGVTGLVAAGFLAVLAPVAWAHGGQFSGPNFYKPPDRSGAPPVGPEGEANTGGGAAELPPETAGAEARLGPDDWGDWWTTQRWGTFGGRPAAEETPGGGTDETSVRARSAAALLAAVAAADDDLSTGALVALGRMGEARAEAALVAALTDRTRTQTVREAAACGLALLGRAAPTADARTSLEMTVIDDRTPERLRAVALYALGLRRETGSIDVLAAPLLTSGAPPQVAAAAATSLGLLGGEEAAALLGKTLLREGATKAAPDLARVYAAHGLALCARPESIAVLRRATEDDDPAVRRAACLALGVAAKSTDDDVQRALRRRLDSDRELSCRHAALLALGRQGHPRSKALLADALGGGRNVHLTYAATALGSWAGAAGDPAAAAPLRAYLRPGGRPDLCAAACVGLALARDRAAAPVLLQIAVGGGDPTVRGIVITVIPSLADRAEACAALRKLLSPLQPSDVRREAATALGALGDGEASAELANLAADGETLYVRAAATVALGKIGGPGSTERLLATLEKEDAEPLLRALSGVGLGILFGRPRERGLEAVVTDLDWRSASDAVMELSTIL